MKAFLAVLIAILVLFAFGCANKQQNAQNTVPQTVPTVIPPAQSANAVPDVPDLESNPDPGSVEDSTAPTDLVQ